MVLWMFGIIECEDHPVTAASVLENLSQLWCLVLSKFCDLWDLVAIVLLCRNGTWLTIYNYYSNKISEQWQPRQGFVIQVLVILIYHWITEVWSVNCCLLLHYSLSPCLQAETPWCWCWAWSPASHPSRTVTGMMSEHYSIVSFAISSELNTFS